MPRLLLALAATLALFRATSTHAAEPALTPAQLAVLNYAYNDFPRELNCANNEVAYAQARLALAQNRAVSYAPFRTFHQYGATYSADQIAQLRLLEARQAADCTNQYQLEVWRQRQAIVAAILLSAQPH
jgi:hypothetical protein